MSGICSAHRGYDADCRLCNAFATEQHPLMTKEEKLARIKDWFFLSMSAYNIPGKELVYTVLCPIDCYSFGWLIGRVVEIDGYPYRVLGVESLAHGHSRRFGESIGLQVESAKRENIL